MGNSFAKMKKQARQLQQQLEKMQQEMQDLEVTGSAGNGLVTIVLCGDNSLKKVSLKPECIDPEDPEALEDLIQAAFEDAQTQLQQKSNDSLLTPSALSDFSANF
ncbi:MAG: YbaB/EbfC family nucleoid-associated protein [Chlamydiota bacterium]